jgi:hypothetical protein
MIHKELQDFPENAGNVKDAIKDGSHTRDLSVLEVSY